jgi:hypothetical protein
MVLEREMRQTGQRGPGLGRETVGKRQESGWVFGRRDSLNEKGSG